MPEVRELFPEIEAKETPELQQRLAELRNSAPEGSYKNLSDEALSEMLVITRTLRKRAASPGSGGRRKAAVPRSQAPIGDLA